MEDEEKIWDRKLYNFSPGKISTLGEVRNLEAKAGDFITVIRQVDFLTKQGTKVVLPEEFFLGLSSRILRKYLQPLKWRRIKSKKQAIEEKVTPYQLMREAREKMSMDSYYGGMGWRGLSMPINKNFLLYSWIEGWELASLGSGLIKLRRYDKPDNLEQVSKDERKKMRRELSKVTRRKRGDFKERILKKGGTRTGVIPSRSVRGKMYDKGMRIDGMPINFKGSRSNNHYASWFDLHSWHTCKDKEFFIAYMRDREEFFCAHDIAFMITSYRDDYNQYYSNPYLVFTPFPKPNPIFLDANKRYRKLVFKKVGGRRVALGKIDREGLLFCEAKATDAKFF